MKGKQLYTDDEIEAIKERVEFAAKEAEEAKFTLEMWVLDWRRRMAEQRAPKQAAQWP